MSREHDIADARLYVHRAAEGVARAEATVAQRREELAKAEQRLAELTADVEAA